MGQQPKGKEMDETGAVMQAVETETQPSEETTGEAPVAAAASTNPDEIQIPENWEPQLKETIQEIQDAKLKKAIFEKVRSLESGYQKKFKDVAGSRKELEAQMKDFEGQRTFLDSFRAVENGMEPERRAQIVAQYGNVPNYMNALAEMDLMAGSDPGKFLVNYCHNMGITAENLQEILTGRAFQQHQNQAQGQNLEKKLMEQIRAEFENRQAQNELNAFINSRDAAGNPIHPHFESVKGVMGALAQVYHDKNIEELYEMALLTNPELKTSAIEEQAKNIQAQKDVQKAKAVLGVKTTTSAPGAKESKTWRNQLDEEIPI
jgi:hypothetical protein